MNGKELFEKISKDMEADDILMVLQDILDKNEPLQDIVNGFSKSLEENQINNQNFLLESVSKAKSLA
jgi:hypothetical protein